MRKSQDLYHQYKRANKEAHEAVNNEMLMRYAHLSELFEQTPSFMVLLRGPMHVFEFANPSFYQLVGHRELIGYEAREAFPEIYGQGFFELLDQVYASGETFRGAGLPALLQRQPNAPLEERFVDFVFQPLFKEGKVVGIFVEGHDATEEVQAKEKLIENEKRLKEWSLWLEQQVQERTKDLENINQSLKISNDDLQQFAHVASHDLKEPIRKIKTFSTRLQEEFQHALSERGNLYLEKIQSATDRMYSMIEGVLAYSMMAAEEQPFAPVDLNTVLHNIAIDLEVVIQAKKITLSVGDLPVISGIPVLIYQLFYNLVNNSIKFSTADVSPIIHVKSTTFQQDNIPWAKITVEDNGIGFDPEFAEKIFSTFTRLNPKDKYEGTGLGLALCRKIVQRHGGTITADGKRNQGAVFTITIPKEPTK